MANSINFAFILFIASALHAAEVDNFTRRYEHFEDSAIILNQEINRRLNIVAQALNAQPTRVCSQETLIKAMKSQFHRELYGLLEEWIDKHPTMDVKRLKLNQSIYREKTLTNWLRGVIGKIGEISGLIEANGVLLGADKIGHFFDEGLSLYEVWKKSGKIDEALKWSIRTEETYFGYALSGVKSYADMVANYQGLHFWAALSEGGLSGEESPYFSCVNGQWFQTRDFDVANYVDHDLDEGINCAQYKRPEMERMIDLRLKELETKSGQPHHCPIRLEECPRLRAKYGKYAPFLLHSRCQ